MRQNTSILRLCSLCDLLSHGALLLLLLSVSCERQQQVDAFGINPRTIGMPVTRTTRQESSLIGLDKSVFATEHRRRIMSSVTTTTSTTLYAAPDLDVISLVVGQENYGLGIVCLLESAYSFFSVPITLSNAIRTIIPGAIAAIVLFAVSGPMIASPGADLNSIGTGLWVATFVTVALSINYITRLIASYSETPKEVAALGLLVAIAGFFSFGQNLIVDGFVTLPSIELPSF